MGKRITVILGDSANMLKEIEPNTIDAIVTDPPSGTNMMIPFMSVDSDRHIKFDNKNKTRYNFKTQYKVMTMLRTDFEDKMFPVFKECFRVIKPGGYGVVWAFNKSVHWTMDILEKSGFCIVDVIIRKLEKKRPKAPLYSDKYSTQLIQETEMWVVVRKCGEYDSATENFNNYGTGFMNVIENSENSLFGFEPCRISHLMYGFKQKGRRKVTTHPTEKTVGWMQHLVKLVCPENGVVLDPFMGSGTTGIACLLENRGFLGVEKEDLWFNSAKERLEEMGWVEQESEQTGSEKE